MRQLVRSSFWPSLVAGAYCPAPNTIELYRCSDQSVPSRLCPGVASVDKWSLLLIFRLISY
jgi:hypothetical protein